MAWPIWWSPKVKDNGEDGVSPSKVDDATSSTSSSKIVNIANPDRLDGQVPKQLRSFTEPQTILATVVLTAACLGSLKLYRTYFRRIPEAVNIKPAYFRKRSIFGKVTSVGDGDNFRIWHTPGGWLAGWGWLPWRRVPTDKKLLKNNTIHIRLAGVDAPELAHFGRPSQPHGQEALDWLTKYLLGRRVRAYVHKPDQYSRVVGTVYVWKGLLRRDVGLQMLRAGLATVYEAKSGAEFGEGLEPKYRNAEWWAKMKRKGIWAGKKADYESPREYKTRYNMGSPDQQHVDGKT